MYERKKYNRNVQVSSVFTQAVIISHLNDRIENTMPFMHI